MTRLLALLLLVACQREARAQISETCFSIRDACARDGTMCSCAPDAWWGWPISEPPDLNAYIDANGIRWPVSYQRIIHEAHWTIRDNQLAPSTVTVWNIPTCTAQPERCETGP